MEIKQLEAIAKQLAPIIKGAVGELNSKLESLRAEFESVKSVPQPEPVDVEAIAKQAAEMVVIPQPEPVVIPEIDLVEVAKQAAALVEVPQPDKPETVDFDAIVKQVAAQIPTPKDGQSVDREDVIKAVSAEFERRFSDLLLHCERKAAETFEKALDRMPKPADGRDALPLESFDISMGEDGRTLTVKMQAGDSVQEKSIRLPVLLDRGAYSAEKSYEAGDVVSHGGSMWIASSEPGGAPGLGGNGWRLAVKRGRDGKDLRDSAATVDTSKGVKV